MSKVLLIVMAILVFCVGVFAEDTTVATFDVKETIDIKEVAKGTVSGIVVSISLKDISIEAAPYFKDRKPTFAITEATKMWKGPEVGADAVKADFFVEKTKVVIYYEGSIATKIVAIPQVEVTTEAKADTSVSTDTK